MVDALFTSTQQMVLGLLFGQPTRRFFATELIGLAGKGSGAVQRELAALTESGLVTIELIGKQKYYQANPHSPIFHKLCAIATKTIGLAAPIKQALTRLKPKITLAAIYGSVAKGSEKASSDIDLLVVSDELEIEKLSEALEPVEQRLSRKIYPTLYKTGEFAMRLQAQNPFLKKILEGETIALIGDKSGFDAT